MSYVQDTILVPVWVEPMWVAVFRAIAREPQHESHAEKANRMDGCQAYGGSG